MANQSKTAQPSQKSRIELEREIAQLKAQLTENNVVVEIEGKYKGYRIKPGILKIRDAQGLLCDSQKVMDAAQKGDETACEILDREIELGASHIEFVGE